MQFTYRGSIATDVPETLPPGWTDIGGAARQAGYRLTRGGNIEIVMDLTGEISGARRGAIPAPMRETTETGAPRFLTGGKLIPGGRRPVDEAQLRLRGTLPEEYARLVVPPRPPSGPPPLPHVPVLRTSEERKNYGVLFIPGAAVAAYREYVATIPKMRLNQKTMLYGAAWVNFTARVDPPMFGAWVRAVRQGGYDFAPGPARQIAYTPETVPETVVLGAPGQVPVTYWSIVAIMSLGTGPETAPKYMSNFDAAMTAMGWHPCARIPRAKTAIWCPQSRPVRQPRLG